MNTNDHQFLAHIKARVDGDNPAPASHPVPPNPQVVAPRQPLGFGAIFLAMLLAVLVAPFVLATLQAIVSGVGVWFAFRRILFLWFGL